MLYRHIESGCCLLRWSCHITIVELGTVGKLKRNNFPVCDKLEIDQLKSIMMTQCLRRGLTLTVCCLCSAAVSKGFVYTTNGASSASGFVGSAVCSKSAAVSFLSHDGGRLFSPSEWRHYDKVAPMSCFMFDFFFIRVYVKTKFTQRIRGLQRALTFKSSKIFVSAYT